MKPNSGVADTAIDRILELSVDAHIRRRGDGAWGSCEVSQSNRSDSSLRKSARGSQCTATAGKTAQ